MAAAPLSTGVSVDAGGAVDDGTFVPDTFSSGGYLETKPADQPSLPNFAATVPHPISPEVWHSARITDSVTTIPGLTPGASYELRLYFLDWYFTRPGQRVFDVHVQGEPALVDFDIIGTAIERGADGRNSFGVERDLTVVADATGTVTVEFLRGKANQPLVNAVSLVALDPPAPLAAGVSVDAGGAVDDGTFVPDTFSSGGYLETKPADQPSLPNFAATVPHPISPEVWHSARITDSVTTIPGLTPGASYELRLYFLDWYFTRPGQRVFDVHVQGEPALVDFDIIGTAIERGADGRNSFGVERDLTVVADATGTVTVEFLRGKANQPLVNALSLVAVAT